MISIQVVFDPLGHVRGSRGSVMEVEVEGQDVKFLILFYYNYHSNKFVT
jgi:hypothetical protein